MKEYMITMTSKGQFTMPVEVRELFSLGNVNNKLKLVLNTETKTIKIEKPITVEEVQRRARQRLKPGIEPLLDARAFYDTRKPRI